MEDTHDPSDFDDFLAGFNPAGELSEVAPDKPIDVSMDDIFGAGPLVETCTRDTLMRLMQTPREQSFTFKAPFHRGNLYVGAMRTLLSRVRAKARKDKRHLVEFQLVLEAVVQVPATKDFPAHDLVTVVRTNHATRRHKSAYDSILDGMNNAEKAR